MRDSSCSDSVGEIFVFVLVTSGRWLPMTGLVSHGGLTQVVYCVSLMK